MERVIKPVFWTSRAIKDLRKIIEFNTVLYGRQKSVEFASELRMSTEILSTTSFKDIGSVDEDCLHLQRQYRKLIFKHYKITYREGKTNIYINKVFDTRRNPKKNI